MKIAARLWGNSLHDGLAIGLVSLGAAGLGATAVKLSLPAAFAILGGLGLAAVILVRPFFGLLLFTFTASFLPFSQIASSVPFTVCESVLLITWVSVFLKYVTGGIRMQFGATEYAVLVLLVYSIAPLLLGMALVPYGELGLVRWGRWIMNVSTFFLAGLLVRDQRSLEAVLFASIAGTFFMLVLAIGSFIRHWNAHDILPILDALHYTQDYRSAMAETFGIVQRISSPWIHPNMLGGFLTLLLPVAALFVLKAREPLRMALLIFLILALAVLLLSISRAAMIGLGFVTLCFILWRVPFAVPAAVVGVALLVAIGIFYAPVQERFASLFTKERTPSGYVMSSTETRLEEYRAFPRAVAEFPFGIGFATNPTALVERYPQLRQISNLWLNYWYKLGLPGMLIFIWITVRWWKEVRLPSENGGFDDLRLYHAGLVGGLIGTFTIGFFDHYFSFQWVLVALFWMFMALSLVPSRMLCKQLD